jgi:hypothetical protein
MFALSHLKDIGDLPQDAAFVHFMQKIKFWHDGYAWY